MKFLPDDYSYFKMTGTPESYEEITFSVYLTYIKNFNILIKETYSRQEELANIVFDSTNYRINKLLDADILRKILFIAWNTEYLASFSDDINNVELIRTGNQWKPIQVYYSIYSSARAAYYSIHGILGDDRHSKILASSTNYFKDKGLFPWCICFDGYRGSTKKLGTITHYHLPKDIKIPNALKRRDLQPIQSVACCIRAEHMNRIDEWKPQKEQYKYLHNPGYTSIFHFLYRLRKKSNYKDAEIFLTNAPDEDIIQFSKDLTSINFSTNCVLETVVLSKVGIDVMEQLMSDYLRVNKKATSVEMRKEIYRSMVL